MGIIVLFLIVLVFYDIVKDRCYSYFNNNIVSSSIDGNSYPVVASYDDQQNAADTIAEINLFTIDVIRQLKTSYLNITPTTPEQIKGAEIASILQTRYSPSSLSENKPTSDKDTSFTQNKGEIISLCLREKQSGFNKIHSIDVLKFVMLHELAHVITPEISHSDLFWTNFRFLLEFCKKKKLYVAPDYYINNEIYCGMTIKYNPEYDNIRTISYFNKKNSIFNNAKNTMFLWI